MHATDISHGQWQAWSWVGLCVPLVLSLSYIEFTGTQIMVTPDPPSPACVGELLSSSQPTQLPYVLCGADA